MENRQLGKVDNSLVPVQMSPFIESKTRALKIILKVILIFTN